MPTSSGLTPILWVRRLLLAFLVVFVSVLAGLWMFGRSGQPESEPAARRERRGDNLRDLLLSGEGFDYEFSEEGRAILRIHGDRMLSDREDNVVLEGVELTVFREDGDRFHLGSASGSYNLKTDTAELRGDVRIEGPDGLTLRTEVLLVHRGQRFESKAPVRFSMEGRFLGGARSLSATLNRKVYRLDGRVWIHTLGEQEPGSLRSEVLIYERGDRLVRAMGNVVLRHGRAGEERVLEARQFSGVLAEDERRLRSVRGQSEVNGRATTIAADGTTSVLLLAGDVLAAEIDPASGDLQRVEVEEGETGPASLASRGEDGIVRRLVAPRLRGGFAAGTLAAIEADGPVRLDEFPAGDPTFLIGWACGEKATARFTQASGLTDFALSGEVEVWQEGVHLRGSEIRGLRAEDRTELVGSPAVLLEERGELEAPLIVRHAGGEVTAEGGVRAELREDRGASLAGRRGPVRVEAAEASWRPADQAVVFRGNVRAWQGRDLLLAAELEERTAEETLFARGGVRTLWNREPEADGLAATNGGDPPAADPAGDDGDSLPAEGPVEISAEQLVYDRRRSLLTYDGGVSARQTSRSLRCLTMDVELGADGKAERITCRGEVQVQDSSTGRTVEGDVAVWEPVAETVRVSGERVRMRERDGALIEGPILIYDFATGQARIESPHPLPPPPAVPGA